MQYSRGRNANQCIAQRRQKDHRVCCYCGLLTIFSGDNQLSGRERQIHRSVSTIGLKRPSWSDCCPF